MYFEDREIENVTEATTGWVGLQYKEGAEIPTEVIHKDEWEAGKSEESSKDRQAIFVKGSKNIQQQILDTLESFKVRFQEVGLLFDLINQAMGKTRDKIINACYGTKDWMSELTVDMLGDSPAVEGEENPHALAVYEALKERGVPIKEVGRVLQTAGNLVNRAQVQRLEKEIGRPMRFWRMDDLAQYIELKSYDSNQEDPQRIQSDPGGEVNSQGPDHKADDGSSGQEDAQGGPGTPEPLPSS